MEKDGLELDLQNMMNSSYAVLDRLKRYKDSTFNNYKESYDEFCPIYAQIKSFYDRNKSVNDKVMSSLFKTMLTKHKNNRQVEKSKFENIDRKELERSLDCLQSDEYVRLNKKSTTDKLYNYFNENYDKNKFELINLNAWKSSDSENIKYLIMTIKHLEYNIIEKVRLTVDCSNDTIKINRYKDKYDMKLEKLTKNDLKLIKSFEKSNFSHRFYELLEIKKPPMVITYKNGKNKIIQVPVKLKNKKHDTVKYSIMAIDTKEKIAKLVHDEGDWNHSGFANMVIKDLDF